MTTSDAPTSRADEVRHLIGVADDLRRQAEDAEHAARMLTCGLDVKAGTYTIARKFHYLMAETLRVKAAEYIAEAEQFEARL